MALIACPECGQNITSDAHICSHCGMPIDPRRAKVDYVTGEAVAVQLRAGARVAHPPLRYSSGAGVFTMAGGAVLVILGSLMPWVRLGPNSVSGVEGDGRATIVIGLLMLILGPASRSSPSRFPRILVLIGASATIVVAGINAGRLRDGLPDSFIGAGVATVLIGGIVALIGALLRDR